MQSDLQSYIEDRVSHLNKVKFDTPKPEDVSAKLFFKNLSGILVINIFFFAVHKWH